MDPLPCLETREFLAFIIDNSPAGIHRAGYNGVASLIPRATGNNLLVPFYAGLNYEIIWMAGAPPYRRPDGFNFEPRCEPMHVERAGSDQVTLVQPETAHSRVSARITFRVEQPCYLHQRVELTAHRRFCGETEPNALSTLWASYIHLPPDRHIYSRASLEGAGELAGWFGITKESHKATGYQVRLLPEGRELDAPGHLEAMQAQPPLSSDALDELPEELWPRCALPRDVDGPLSFYYGLCHGSLMFLMMFRQPERVRLAYSPSGGGLQPAWSPAWDYVLHVPDAVPGETYTWDVCLALMEFPGRAAVLQEVRRYLGRPPAS